MPKIPTFVTQARPTTEVGDVRSNIQISPSQNIATALAPITKTIMNYAAVEKLNQSKNEALELENQSILELNTAVQEASKLKNKEQANTFLINESKRIRDAYGAKASSSQVRSIFDNNYLKEEQKQITIFFESSRLLLRFFPAHTRKPAIGRIGRHRYCEGLYENANAQ